MRCVVPEHASSIGSEIRAYSELDLRQQRTQVVIIDAVAVVIVGATWSSSLLSAPSASGVIVVLRFPCSGFILCEFRTFLV